MKNKQIFRTATINHSTDEGERIRLELHRDGDIFSWITESGEDTGVNAETIAKAMELLRDSRGMDCWDLRIKGE